MERVLFGTTINSEIYRTYGHLEKLPWHGFRLHPLQLPEWISLVGPRGSHVFPGALMPREALQRLSCS
jgi:hypothetical protein